MTAIFIIVLALFFINYLHENFFNNLREEESKEVLSSLPPPSPSLNKVIKPLRAKKNRPSFSSATKTKSFPFKKESSTPSQTNLILMNKEPQLEVTSSRAKQLVEKLSSLNQLILYQEILAPPKSLRKKDE